MAIPFRWDDREYTGFSGDTLASALLAAGERVIGRSVSRERPRGIMAAGFEEANAFAQIGEGGASEPLVRMHSVELYRGLIARSRSTRGYLCDAEDVARFGKRYAHCDLLIVGGGPTGIAAALVAAMSGVRTILVEHELELGGALLRDSVSIGGKAAAAWVAGAARLLGDTPDVTVLTGTTATIALDQNGMILVERARRVPGSQLMSQGIEKRMWHVRATAIVLATGALERPIVFQDNDRPGIVLATAARAYLNRFALVPERGVVFTTNDDGYRTALDWRAAGANVEAVVDPRAEPTGSLPRHAAAAGIRVLSTTVINGTLADDDGRLRAVRTTSAAGEQEIECDMLAVSGGFDPHLNLHQQLRGDTRWDDRLLCSVPHGRQPDKWIGGAAAGHFTLRECLADGATAATEALSTMGVNAKALEPALTDEDESAKSNSAPLWSVPAPDGDESRSFVDLHRDVTVSDIGRALNSGIRHVEHVKRYTLMATGVEQGRSAKINGGVLTAAGTGRPIADVGTSSARPPVEPMLFHAVAGRARKDLLDPVRTTAIHASHVANGAVFERTGQWLRPRCFPLHGESIEDATLRECRAVREGVGMMDVSTLGKIDVQGPDAMRFLDRLYINAMASLEAGKGRYGVMCKEDGTILDDGVVLRLASDRCFVTTTSGGAAMVLDWMEQWLQTQWRDLRVWLTSVTEEWASVAVAGPRSRAVVASLTDDVDVSKSAFPFLAIRQGTVCGVRGQIARVSFSGELAYEVSVPAPYGLALWDALTAAGRPHDIVPFGLEASHVLRAEKGYFIVGQETDGTTIPADVGLGRMVSERKDFIGKRSLALPAMSDPEREQLVGFFPTDPTAVVPEGATIVRDASKPPPLEALGHVTASHMSPALGRTFGLAMVASGFRRKGELLHARADGRAVPITLCDAVMYDPDGAKRDG